MFKSVQVKVSRYIIELKRGRVGGISVKSIRNSRCTTSHLDVQCCV